MAFWTPDLASPLAWFDATDLATLDLDGSNRVAAWADKSLNVPDVTQTDNAKKPTREVSGGASFVRFDGVDDILRNNTPVLSQSRTILAVARFRAASAVYGALAADNSSISTQPSYDLGLLTGTPTAHRFFVRNLTGTQVAAIYGSLQENATNLFAGVDNGTTLTPRWNGTAPTGASVAASRPAPGDLNRFSLGALWRDPEVFHAALDLMELIVVPNTADIALLEGYAAHKWGAASLLPSNHPWKGAAPYLFTGTTRDALGVLASRNINVIRDSDRACIATATSAEGTGAFSLLLPAVPHTFVFSGEPGRNALVFAGVAPQ